MSDEPKGAPAPEAGAAAPIDEIKNLKAEINRKLENTTAQLQELMNQFKAQAAPAAPKPEKKLSDVMYESPEEYTNRMLETADQIVDRKLAAREEALAKQNAVIGALVADFPELSQADSELSKKAVEVFATMSAEEKKSPLAYKTAVKEAALDLGVRPKSKRAASQDDSFSLGGGDTSKRPSKKDELDEATAEFARIMGRDPEKVKAVKKTRKNYGTWE